MRVESRRLWPSRQSWCPGIARRPLWGALLLLWAAQVQAHVPGEAPLPDEPGLKMGAAVAWSWVDADHDWPAPRLPGVLGTGATADKRNGGGLEHGVLSAGWRPADWLGLQVAAGWHDDGDAHIEAAWLEARHTVTGGEAVLGVGRNSLPVGEVVTAAGEFDLFGAMPLAKRAAFDGNWIDDGINVRWNGFDRFNLRIDAGVWRTGKFPAAADPTWSPMLHAGIDVGGGLQLDAFVARVRAPKRGSFVSLSENAHSHGAPSCDRALFEIACFEGHANLAGVSGRWHAATLPVEVGAAWLTRREQGDLYDINGDARYRGHIDGGWVDLRWDLSPRWTLAGRFERVSTRNRLHGSGAAALARDTGLAPNDDPAQRHAAALRWTPLAAWPTLQLSLEAGSERVGGDRNRFAMLRVLWRGAQTWQR